ncbi:ArsB/NhaD family transporter, partial [Bradyrhizobium sp.]|uniref:ArsB/NhaD family transporter n=1 Tax=Bradyrhizobium sp. TaxID=376 RepID=UPI00391CBD63
YIAASRGLEGQNLAERRITVRSGVAGSVAASDHLPHEVVRTILIGVDLGPNISVTGSLATILWLTALRREKIQVSAWQFLKIGLVATPPALIAALAAAMW